MACEYRGANLQKQQMYLENEQFKAAVVCRVVQSSCAVSQFEMSA